MSGGIVSGGTPATVSFNEATRIYRGATMPAVDRLDLEVNGGELLVLVGPSGSGKSTALRMVAGLEGVDEGRIFIGERDVTGLPPKDRDISMVFQNYALYPHMTVARNIGYHLSLAGMPTAVIRERVANAATLLGLTEHLDRRPALLSGGQRQRVAMGRAIVREPRVFLLDEPLSNLDAKLRTSMRTEIASLQRRLNTTMLYVTHDQVEAMTMGDRVAVLADGVLQQCDTPVNLFERPANSFVAGFIGSPAMNLFALALDASGARLGDLPVPLPREARPDAASVVVGVRPEDFGAAGAGPGLAVEVEAIEELGSSAYVHATARLATANVPVVARWDARSGVAPGESLRLAADPERMHLFDAESGERLS